MFISALGLQAQLQNGYYLPFYLGYSNQVVKDASLSPVSYSGSLGSIASGFTHQGKNWIDGLTVLGHSGILRSDIAPEEASNVLLVGARVSYKIARRFATISGFELYAGLSSISSWDYREVGRYANNSFNFNGFFSLGPYVSTQKNFELWGQQFNMQYELSLPVASYVLRPSYIKPQTGGDFGYSGIESWGDFFQVDSKCSLFWQISEQNYLCLSYQWEYTQLNLPNKIQLAQHFIGLSTITRL
jgi:hypothetical protein